MKGRMQRSTLIIACIVVFLVRTAEAASPPPQEQGQKPGQFGAMAIAVARQQPEITFDPSRAQGKSAGLSALEGALACTHFNFGSASGMAGGALALLALACLPVGAVIGAAARPGGASEESIVEAERRIRATLNELDLRAGLHEAISAYAQASGLRSADSQANAGAAQAGDTMGIDTLVEVGLPQVTAFAAGENSRLIAYALKISVRLTRTRDGTILDHFLIDRHITARSIEDWQADAGKPLLEAFAQVYREVAEDVIDELLVYRPLDNISMDGPRQVPAYVLAPLYPEIDTNIFGFGLRTAAPHPIRATKIASNRPTLGWEPFPRPLDFGDAETQPQDIRYEVRIYAAQMDSKHSQILPTQIVYSRTGLAAPHHEIETELKYCEPYFWTVRARFRLDGVERSTEWTGAYPGGLSDPRRWRRSDYSWLVPLWMRVPPKTFYPAFVTPSADNAPCVL